MNTNDPQSGKPELNEPVEYDGPAMPQPIDKNRRRAEAALRALMEEMSPVEKAVGIELRVLLQTDEEREAQHAVHYPQERNYLLADIQRYFTAHQAELRNFKTLDEAMENLARQLRVWIEGREIGLEEVKEVLIHLVYQTRMAKRIRENS